MLQMKHVVAEKPEWRVVFRDDTHVDFVEERMAEWFLASALHLGYKAKLQKIEE